MDDLYRNPGPLQFDGPGADAKAVTLCVEDQDYMGRIKKLQEYLDKVLRFLLPWFYFIFIYIYIYTCCESYNVTSGTTVNHCSVLP